MNLYNHIIIILLFSSVHIDAFWGQLYDSISTKISNTTQSVTHKEFSNAEQLQLANENGTIIINSWKQTSIAIEVIINGSQAFHKNIKVDMNSIDNIVKINTLITDEKIKGNVVFNILLPKNIDVSIFTKEGDIIVKDVTSTLHLETLQGDIKLINPHDTLKARTHHGDILIRTDYIEPEKDFEITSDKGNIEIYTTDIMNAFIHGSAPQGKITSELPIVLTSTTTLLNAQAWKTFRQSVRGAIGNPLAKLTMVAHNGIIEILPYMKQNDIF